jgi:hypothetical protein
MTVIRVKVAREIDFAAIINFLCLHFNAHEPIKKFHVRKSEPMDPPPTNLIKDCIASGTTLMAFSGDELAGVLVAGKIDEDVAEKDLKYAEVLRPKGVDIYKFSSFIGAKTNLCERLKISCSLHIHMLSVSSNHQRKGIAKKLFNFCILNGRINRYPAIGVDCTSDYTAKIAESFGMKLISTVTYDEYNEHIGEKLFVPTGPHKDIRSYAKLY